MGLDTVELVVSFERYFGLEIPDAVSEKLYTIADVAAWLSQQVGVAGQRHSAVRATVAKQLLSELPPNTNETSPLNQPLPTAQALKTYRYGLRSRYGLVLPGLSAPSTVPAKPSLWERLTGRQLPATPHWSTQTLTELIDWVVAFHYVRLLQAPLASQYEIERVVIGLTSDKSGVEVEEIRLDSSFTNDLGMD